MSIEGSNGQASFDVKVTTSLHPGKDIFIQAGNRMVLQQALHFSTENAYNLIKEIATKSNLRIKDLGSESISVYAPEPDRVTLKRLEVAERFYGSERAKISSVEQKLIERIADLELERKEK